MPRVYWEQWDFTEFEIDLRNYARANNLEYDKKHPLKMLPKDAAKKALDIAGGSYKEIAKFMDWSEKTVAGWFAPGRTPSRGTVAKSIFPALCEIYARHNELDILRFHFVRYGYIYEGKRPTKEYIRMIQSRVFLILTTGESITDADRALSMKRSLDTYHRGLLYYAATFLDKAELEDLAHSALYTLISHANRPGSNKDFPDGITKNYRDNEWFFFAGSDLYKSLFPDALTLGDGTDIKPGAADYPYFAGVQLESEAILQLIADMSDDDLVSLAGLVGQEQARRAADMELMMEQMQEAGEEEPDDGGDEDIWDHWAAK